ncbi:MAG: hypothetical protein K1X67_01940 [Fimbriimonadaceae bacterium]|nr:hypothetical protein [Fimbriimonadaceae bacterium]
MRRWLCALVTVGTLGIANASTWNLSADWSDATNPFGPWTLKRSSSSPFSTNWAEWAPGVQQPMWADEQITQTAHVPAWGRAITKNVYDMDLPRGTIFAHGAETWRTGTEFTSAMWTSPMSGTVYLHGQIWPPRHIGRTMNWYILVNGASVTEGTFPDVNPYNSQIRMNLNEGSGGSGALEVVVVPGTTIELLIQRPPSQLFSDFLATYFCISTHPFESNLYINGELQDYVGDPYQVPITVTIMKPSDGAVVREDTILLSSESSIPILACLEGDYTVCVKASHWLRQCFPVTFDENGATVNFSLINGDCDGDNEIGIGDYAMISSAYDTSPGDPGWAPMADLNGDEAVDIADYAILSANYGLTGD